MEASWKLTKTLVGAWCLCSLITAGTARADARARQTHNAEVLVYMGGHVLPNANVQFRTLDGDMKTVETTREGVHLITDAPEKLVMQINYLGGSVQVGVGLEFENSQVQVYIIGREIITKVVELSGKPAGRPAAAGPNLTGQPTAAGPNLGRQTSALGAAQASTSASPLLGTKAAAPARQAFGTGCGTVEVTQSTSQTITSGNSVSCNAGGFHTNNHYYRAFAVSNPFTVCEVEIGVELAVGAAGTQPIEVFLYNTSNVANLNAGTLVGSSGVLLVSDQSLSIVTLPVVGATLTGQLTVEIFSPSSAGDAAGVDQFFIGSNALGQTGPSYIAAAGCGLPSPTDLAAIGFAGMHIVMNVHGDAGGEPPVCGNGIIEAGEQCDDGNTVPGDGCDENCQIEGGGNPACNAGAGDCCVADGTPGCNDPDCCNTVCTADPFCCDVSWDSICAGEAADLCGDFCGGGGDCPTCCTPSGGLGCEDAECTGIVCGVDPFCCDVAWDGICADEANTLCPCCGAAPIVCGDGVVGPGEQCDPPGSVCGGTGVCLADCTCDIECPPGSIDEAASEPNCGLPTDTVNGGCNSSPNVFQDILCGDTVCGSGAFDGGTRDTDWYKLVLAGPAHVAWTATATFNEVIGIVNNFGIDSCAGVSAFLVFATAPPGVPATVEADLSAGTWYLFAAPDFIGTVPCPSEYVAAVTECTPIIIECGNGVVEIGEQCDDGNTNDGDGCSSLCTFEPPNNDNCADRRPISNGLTCTDNIGASTDGPSPCGGLANDIWYNYTADFTGNLIVKTCPGGGGGGSNCCFANGGLGCDDPDCQATVCAVDAFCCDVAWDGICAGEAADLCGDLCAGGCTTNFDTVLAAYDGCSCGTAPSSNCCVAHAGVGCDDPDCQATVCAADPFCCDVAWDGICAGEAAAMCGDLCTGGGGFGALLACNDDSCGLASQIVFQVVAGQCYKIQFGGFFGATGTAELTIEKPICGDGIIQPGEVCDPPDGVICGPDCQFIPPNNDDCIDRRDIFNGQTPFSTTGATTDGPAQCAPSGNDIWYNYNADFTGNLVIHTCPGGGPGSNCCFANGGLGCDDPDCQAAVCAIDAFCCDVAWDGICAGEAATECGDLCGGGGGGPLLDTVISVFEGCNCPGGPASNCCFANGGLGCDDPDCQATVCAVDAFCCDVAWDGICAGEAAMLCGDLCSGGLVAIACNDDGPCGPTGFQSIVTVQVTAGTCYKIQLGGFGGAVGSGVITIEKPICGNGIVELGEQCDDGNTVPGDGCDEFCTVEFCAGDEDIDEASSEPNCGLPVDTVNGGCNSVPPVFTNIACGQSVCGSGAFDGATRDTDWYKIVLAVPTEVTWSGSASFNSVIGIVDNNGVDSCAGVTSFLVFDTGAPGETKSVTACLDTGTWYLFFAPDFIGTVPCPSEYTAAVSCVEGCEPPVICGPSNPNDCNVANGTPGCGDTDCCEAVCAIDPFCCDVAWDGICAGEAAGFPQCADGPGPCPDDVDPPNDCCENRIEIFEGATPTTNIGANTDGPPSCGGIGSDVWYNYNAPCDGTVTVDTCGSGFDTVLAAYDGCTCPSGGGPSSNCCFANMGLGCDDPECEALICGQDAFCCDVSWDGLCAGAANAQCEVCMAGGGLGPELACNDDTCGLQSQISFAVVAGNCYKIRFGGFNGAQGTATINLHNSNFPCEVTGACCFGTECLEAQTAEECANAGGAYEGDGTTCFNEVGGTVQDHVTMPNLAIPDNLPAGVNSTIMVAGNDVIADVDVDLVINHTWVGDLCVTLTHGATTINLIQEIGNATPGCGVAGFGCSSNNLNVILDDQGAGGALDSLACPGDALPYPTSPPNYTPVQPLAGFNGMTKDGVWTLNVRDSAAADLGTLVQWSLHFTTPGTLEPKCTGCTGDDECDDGNACTNDICNADGTCSYTPVNCDDGNACNGVETCNPMTGCVPGTPPNCDDGNACNGVETCVPPGGCVPGTPPDCDDDDACTLDFCDPASGCYHEPVECDDGNACTADGCDPAIGCTHAIIDCNDGNPCTTDTCNPATGCVNTPECTSDEDCVAGEVCEAGCCVGGATEYPLDIKPHKCPNKIKYGTGAAVWVVVLGTVDDACWGTLDASQIATMNLRVCGCEDYVSASPRVKDWATPYCDQQCDANPSSAANCACHDEHGDGIDDVRAKFDVPDIQALITDCIGSQGIGTYVEMEVFGVLDDGSAYNAHDCVLIDRNNGGP